ncbi:MAG: hypothetical protein ACJA0H_000914, partial [Francisellaceae bacterium]
SSHPMRTEHLTMIKKHGRMYWQRYNQYGKRNYSELPSNDTNEYWVIKCMADKVIVKNRSR